MRSHRHRRRSFPLSTSETRRRARRLVRAERRVVRPGSRTESPWLVTVCDDEQVRVTDLDRRIVRLAIPALGTLAIEPLYILVDTAIVGRISTDALAGVAIAATVLLTISSLAGFLQ